MRHVLLTLTLCLLVLGGCALLDGLLGERETQARDDAGRPLFENARGELTPDPVDPATGLPNQPRMITLVDPDGAASFGNLLAGFGPWGALAGAFTTLGAGVYARGRNRQRLREAGLRQQAEQQLDGTKAAAAFAVQLLEHIKEGKAVDCDGNGRVSLEEVKAWVRRQGEKFSNPALLQSLVKTAENNLNGRAK